MKRANSALEMIVFCALCLGAGAFVVAVRARTNWDQDIWWHLATGRWIAQHGWVPATDPFSQFGRDKEWVAYSWLFALVAYGAHAIAGLRGIVLFTGLLGTLIAGTAYTLIRRCGATPFRALPLTAAAFYAVMPLTTPRPWLFSILFFLVELHVIVAARRGRRRALALLPCVFALWANIHIQFTLGLVVLLAAILDAVAMDADRANVRLWIGAGIASGVATLLNPYNIRIYRVVSQYTDEGELLTRIGELSGPTFRTSTDWVILAFVLTAAGCLGWQLRERVAGLFWPLLFAFGAWLGFRMQRDAWFVVMTAACIIGRTEWRTERALNNARVKEGNPERVHDNGRVEEGDPERAHDNGRVEGWLVTISATATAALLLLWAALPLNENQLETNVARSYPAAAATVVETQGPAGPLYNYFDWGGYLIWRLPQLPVSMDGRTRVHGTARIVRHVDTWQGRTGWRDDPEMTAARIVVGPRDLPLMSLLRLDDRFTLLYEDSNGPAVVFERK